MVFLLGHVILTVSTSYFKIKRTQRTSYLSTLDVTRKVSEKLEVVFIFLALSYQRKNKPHVPYSMGECLKILSIGNDGGNSKKVC